MPATLMPQTRKMRFPALAAATADPEYDTAYRHIAALVKSTHLAGAKKLEILRRVAEDIETDTADAEFQAARIDAVGVEEELRNAEGGGVSSSEFAKRLGINSPETVRSYLNQGRIFAWQKGQRNQRYPAWQIYKGQLLEGLPEVLALLRAKNLSPYSVISFFVYRSEELEGKSPLELLRTGNKEAAAEVLGYAARYGDIGS